MKPPYFQQPKRSFWASTIKGRSPDEIDFSDFYRPKLKIGGAALASAGACFAECLTPGLKAAGFNYLDVESPPPNLPAAQWKAYGYNCFSARFGHIQTSRQLWQLLLRAAGKLTPKETYWKRGAGVADPFRPNTRPAPYSSVEELERDQREHLARVLHLFETAEVFYFTLSQTETWECLADGAVLPLSPGLLTGGKWDPARYRFLNLTYNEVRQDLLALLAETRRINPNLRYILGVSPTYLVGTAGPEHVLAADVYSKSTLRAAAGDLALSDDAFDYFPAYDMISTVPTEGVFYREGSRRGPSTEGCKLVMDVFTRAHGILNGQQQPLLFDEAEIIKAFMAER